MKKEKKGLMTQYPCARGRAFVCKNIGDYVQSIASKQYIDKIDEYIEQEEANTYFPADKKKIRLIMNGWFQWRAENWPPSEYIHPLLVSMHISPLRSTQLLTPEGIAFLKKNGPVGCRDLFTEELLKSKGVPAYFSACVTLTLGKKYRVKDSERNEKIYFVDPYFEVKDFKDMTIGQRGKAIFQTLWSIITHPNAISKLAKKHFFEEYSPTGFLDRDRRKIRSLYKASAFYKTYSKKFDKQVLLDAEYITHWMDVDMSKDTNLDLLNYAERLVKKYAKAKMVVTSRIHAGLPCLGMHTPVVFIANEAVVSENGNFNTPGRLGGLLDFFRILTVEKSGFSTSDAQLKGIKKFTSRTKFENKTNWEFYAKKLDEQCSDFMK